MGTKLSEYAIGIDMGTNSIGWSVIEEQNGESKKFIDCGSRIFIRMVEDKTPTPKNKKRRDMRLMRRVIERRHRRKMRLRNYLISKQFLPQVLKGEPNPEVELNKLGNPYEIRAKALDEELTPNEFGRAMLHLGTRRGFLSNRKTAFGDLRDDLESQEILQIEDKNAESDKEESNFKEDIKKLREEIAKEGKRTLGEYLATLGRKRNRGESHDLRTDRQMYQEEFEKIFEKQSELNPGIYAKEVEEALKKIIFFQRPLRWNKNTIGNCSLEPKKKRVNYGRLEFQQFRYWQDINNLNWIDTETGEICDPSPEQKNLIADELEKNKNLTWAKIRPLLKLNRKTKFNLEKVEGKRSGGIRGNTTAFKIREVIGDDWDSYDENKQKQLVEDLISSESKKGLKNRLVNHWKFDSEKAIKLAVLELEEGYGNLSLKAIDKILPFLKEGRVYSKESDKEEEKGAVQMAGYEDITKPVTGENDTLKEIPFIPNPIVKKALYEVRRVVNAIIKEYGKPTAIRIEMARDLEMNTTKYKNFLERQKKNTEANEEAAEKYEEIRKQNPHLGLREHINHQDKLKYRLWKESDCKCSYSGKCINLTDLWSADVEIDHIIPYSRSLDNSYMNKVVCFAKENREKGNRTPLEAFGNTDQWDTIEGIIKPDGYPDSKKRRIRAEETDTDFINNQLTDARYMAKETGKYMRTLGCDVTFTKGGATSWLRHQWGLNSILGDTGEKNRADHRHHAIDATVIALTNRSLYQKVFKYAKQADDESISPEHGLEVPAPLEGLRSEVEDAVNKMIVSHSTNRKLTGAFHKETVYGIREENGRKGIVIRKKLTEITEAVLKNKDIICPVIREAFERYVWEQGGLPNAKKALREKSLIHPKTGDIIRHVRVWESKVFSKTVHYAQKDESGKVLKVFKYGNTHHVEIVENMRDKKYKGIFVSTMEAAERIRILKKSIVKTNHGEDWKFIMSLCKNDTVSVEKNGERKLYRIQKLGADRNRIYMRFHTDATLKNEGLDGTIPKLMTEYKMKKESINALGKPL